MSDDTVMQAAIRRKVKALEEAGSDPAKIAELRAQLPSERRPPADHQETTAKVVPDGSESDAKDSGDEKLGDPINQPKMAATRGVRRAPAKSRASKT
jgi:hypothetical protein